jgi:hypothetical protein
MADKLDKDEEMKLQNAEMFSQNLINKKRTLLLEELHRKDTVKIKSLMADLEELSK